MSSSSLPETGSASTAATAHFLGQPVGGSRHRRSRSTTRSTARRHGFEQKRCRGDRELYTNP